MPATNKACHVEVDAVRPEGIADAVAAAAVTEVGAFSDAVRAMSGPSI